MSTSRSRWSAALLAAIALSSTAYAVPTIDGAADAEYGAALSIQNTRTHFGDNNLGDLIATRNGGSEIDQVFATVSAGRLYVTVTGNLQNNFNKLEVYLDVDAGGVNSIDSSQLPASVDPFSGGAFERQQGLTFDAGFEADHYLTFSHGREQVGAIINANNDREFAFWAMTAHYADLTDGPFGAVVSAGMQLGPQGRPVVLKFPFNADFENDADVDGSDLLVWQRHLDEIIGDRTKGDANGDLFIDEADLAEWRGEFGGQRQLSDIPYNPGDTTPPTSALVGPALPNLAQGQLIDKNYVAAHGVSGGNLIAPELEFALAEDPGDPNTQGRNRRNMENAIGLEVALNNSNIAGVEGSGGEPWDTAANPNSVLTGLEFSIPLSEIGSPTGPIKLLAFINGTGHDYASNQFSGTGILRGNLGGNGAGVHTGNLAGVNLSAIPGDQFVTIPAASATAVAGVPEPNAAALAAWGLLGVALGRRRRA